MVCSRHKCRKHPALNALFAKSQRKIIANRAICAY
nr:MAG TPA: hypothetical protein [Caudoviricetes sp.]